MKIERRWGKARSAARPVEKTADRHVSPQHILVCRRMIAPKANGTISPGKRWDQATAVNGSLGAGQIEMRACHDGKNLYLLLTTDAQSNESAPQNVSLYFEDDGRKPSLELDETREDCKYVGASGAPEGFRDAHWEDGWSVKGEYGPKRSGGVKAMLHRQKWATEFWMPLDSGESGDIEVRGDEELGFAICRRPDAWPRRASPYRPRTWGLLRIYW